MAQIISNIIQNSLSGMVAGAVTTAGNYAGDAVSGVGNMIEAKGHSIGNGKNVMFIKSDISQSTDQLTFSVFKRPRKEV